MWRGGKSWEEEFVKPTRQENSVRKSALHVDRNRERASEPMSDGEVCGTTSCRSDRPCSVSEAS